MVHFRHMAIPRSCGVFLIDQIRPVEVLYIHNRIRYGYGFLMP